MHICMASSGGNPIYPNRMGAIEPFIWDLSAELSKLGHTVSLFGAGRGELKTNNLKVKTLTYNEQSLRPLQKTIGNLPINPINIVYGKYLFEQIFALQKKQAIDIIHINNIYSGPITALSKRALGIPSVCSLHNEAKMTLPIDSCDKLLAVSEYIAHFFIEKKNVNPKKVVVLPAGINVNVLKAVKSPEAAKKTLNLEEKTILLFVGRKCPEKGPQVLIRALPKIIQHCPNAIAVFVGPDYFFGSSIATYTKWLKQLAVSLGVQNYVLFLNFISDDKLKDYYTAADIAVCPSTWREPMGKVVLEALSYSKPVVASNIGGISETINNGRNGLLITPNNCVELADAIITLLDNKGKSYEMGLNGRRLVEERFAIEVVAKKCAEIYENVIKNK